jgi:hypothetical protein
MKWRSSSTRSVGRGRLRSGRGYANANKRVRKYSAEEIRVHEQRLRDAGLLRGATANQGKATV